MRLRIAAGVFLVLLFPFFAGAEVFKGMYGVSPPAGVDLNSYASQLKAAGLKAVFVPADKAVVAAFKKRGFEVYVSVNAFGGSEAWERYPDSMPVQADGRLIGASEQGNAPGGVCPSHRGWRQERLKAIQELVEGFRGEVAIDGIWLDFLRYPGVWEAENPRIPDTCYCPRCLRLFRQQTGIALPADLDAVAAADWIDEHCPYEWMKWKKRQITSFAEEVRGILERADAQDTVKLGVFLIPWTKGEYGNAVSYILAQDVGELSAIADIVSPMLYHRISGRPVSWVGQATDYFREAAGCSVWPIVQAGGCDPREFSSVLDTATREGGAEAVLVFALQDMTSGLWEAFGSFQGAANLITNPGFGMASDGSGPVEWRRGAPAGETRSKSSLDVAAADRIDVSGWEPLAHHRSLCLGISAGTDRGGVWSSPLPSCTPGETFLFESLLYRHSMENGVYPRFTFWGEEHLVNVHMQVRRFQPVRLHVTCPEEPAADVFEFVNHHPGHTFWMSEPRLVRVADLRDENAPKPAASFFEEGFYPIGVYGAEPDALETVKAAGFNTVITDGRKETIEKCHELGLKYVVSVPKDPDRLTPFLDELAKTVRSDDLAFYVNDEPGIHAFPRGRAQDIQRLIKARFPDAATCMAVVRPRVCRDYLDAADFFLLDQYPVPHMPMTWLSDSMDRAARDVGRSRMAAVVQAFGGRKWSGWGWPRMPQWHEMDCLAFLSVVHGARGVFFFSFSEAGATQEGVESLKKVTDRLHLLQPWLSVENLPDAPEVSMVSSYRADPGGRPAIRCCLRRTGQECLVIAVNTIGTFVEGMIAVEGPRPTLYREVFSGEDHAAEEGRLRARLGPYEVKAFSFEVGTI